MLPDQPEVGAACICNVNALKRECEIYGMPLMRQPGEVGADFFKAAPCDNVQDYHRMIEIAQRVPMMEHGARCIVYGYLVIHNANPAGITRAELLPNSWTVSGMIQATACTF